VAIDSSCPLATVWGAARTVVTVETEPWPFLILRTGDDTFAVLTAVCTHAGCLVTLWDRPIFVCPCHSSGYDHQGTVVQGPAPEALRRFPSQFSRGVLTFQL
jgi:Rieske Fe-S protein